MRMEKKEKLLRWSESVASNLELPKLRAWPWMTAWKDVTRKRPASKSVSSLDAHGSRQLLFWTFSKVPRSPLRCSMGPIWRGWDSREPPKRGAAGRRIRTYSKKAIVDDETPGTTWQPGTGQLQLARPADEVGPAWARTCNFLEHQLQIPTLRGRAVVYFPVHRLSKPCVVVANTAYESCTCASQDI